VALSLRGVARRYGGVAGAFAVIETLFGEDRVGQVSLRERSQTMARQEFAFEVRECIYGWSAGFQQTWSHILVRIRLDPVDTGTIMHDDSNNVPQRLVQRFADNVASNVQPI
jgi:hypothetical protein